MHKYKVFLIGFAVLSALCAAAPPQSAHVCVVASWATRLVAERHTFDLMAAKYPLTNWSIALLPGSMSARTSVQSYVLHPRSCDVLIAAGGSTATIAMSPLVPTSTAWTDASATSQELSNVANHPSFNRVIPADDVAGRAGANIAFRLGWTTVSILCENSAYGRSLVDAFTTALTALGGQVDVARCWESGATPEEIEGRVNQVLAQRTTRQIFVVSSDDSSPVLEAMGLHKQATLLMVESCTDASLTMPGTICAVYSALDAPFEAFRQSLMARDFTPLLPEFAAADYTDAAAIRASQSTTSFYAALAHDGLQHAMHGVYTYPDANRTAYPTMAEYLRGYSTSGLTGVVELTPNGDRPNAPMKVMNSYVDAVTGDILNAVVGTADTRTLVLANFTATANRPAQWYWLNSSFSSEIVSNALPTSTESAGFPVWAIVVIAVVAVALIAVAIFAATRPKPLEHCPLDDSRPFSVLFVGLANEAALNDHFTAESVARATQAMAKLVRRAVRTTKCYEAQRINDGTFMIVAKSPDRALECATRIAADVNSSDECDKLLVIQPVAVLDDNVSEVLSRMSDRSKQSSNGSPPKHPPRSGRRATSTAGGGSSTGGTGTVRSHQSQLSYIDPAQQNLRVTVGVAHGFGTIDHDEEHGVLSYRGALLATAAAATDAGVAGQIVVTERLIDALQEENVTVPGTFDLYMDDSEDKDGNDKKKKAAGGVKKDASDTGSLFTYLVPNYPIADAVAASIDRAQKRRARNNGGSNNHHHSSGGGAIAAALARAESGVAPRRCAVAIVELAILAKSTGKAAPKPKQLASVLAALNNIARKHKCHIHDIVGTSVTVSANAVGAPVSVPSIRLTQCLRDVLDYVEGLSDAGRGVAGAASAGMASGSTVAGSVDNVAVVAGDLMHQALLAQATAEAFGLRCVLATQNLHESDVAAKFVVTTVDVSAAPVNGSPRLVQLCVVSHERNSNDGEWLYNFRAEGGESATDSWEVFASGAPAPTSTAEHPGDVNAPSPVARSDAGDDGGEAEEARTAEIGKTRLAAARSAGGDAMAYAVKRSVELIGVRGTRIN